MTAKYRVLFLHGFMGSALNWGRILNLIDATEEAKGFAVDLLGHALKHPTDSAAYENAHKALTEDLIKELQRIQPTHVVAHSFSLRPALLSAALEPKLIPHLIVEDSSPEIPEKSLGFLADVVNAPVPFRTREEAKAYMENKYGVQSALSRFFMSNIRSRPDGLADWRFDRKFLEKLLGEALKKHLWTEWKAFPNKIDIVYGNRVGGLSKEYLDKMLELKPEARVMALDAGHWVHSDQPEAFVEAVTSLLS